MRYREFKPGDKAIVMIYPTPLKPTLSIFTATVDSVKEDTVYFDDPRIPFEAFYYNDWQQRWRSVLVDPMLGQLVTLVESVDEPINMMRQRLTQYGASIPTEDYEKASWILANLDTLPLPILRWAFSQLNYPPYLGKVVDLSKEAWVAETSYPDAVGVRIEDTYYSPYDYRIEED